MNKETNWLKKTVAQGLGKLVVLRLTNQPPEEMIAATAEIWVQALLTQKLDGGWQENEDKWRLEQGFMQLCAECERFPAPKMLLERLPKRKVLELPTPAPRPLTWEEKRRHQAFCQQLREIIRGNRVR